MGMPCRKPHEPTQEMCFVVTVHSEFKSGWYTQTVMTFVSHLMVLTSLLQCGWAPGVLKIQSPFDSVYKE